MSVEDSESRRFELNIWLAEFFSGRSWRNIWPGFFFFRFFVLQRLEPFFVIICAHSERYRHLMASIFEIQTFFGQHRVSIGTV